MELSPKPAETFRGDFTFRNSAAAILRFPFPFPKDDFRYGVNLTPHLRGGSSPVFDAVFDLDEHYLGEMREREIVLRADPKRCQVLPHMVQAQWDTLELLMDSLAADYPAKFSLIKAGTTWHWRNHLLGLAHTFTFGEEASLPCPPFEYITRQVQGDFTLQDQRGQNLFMDGGMVTGPADWSLNFDLGMSFHEWHKPVPLAGEMGIFDKALAYLLRLPLGQPVRRLNWSLTANPWLDTAPETREIWGADKAAITAENIGVCLCLRVELQTLTRLPRSNAILFGIRTYLLRFEELVRVKKWAARLHRVLRGLHPDLIAYKGISGYHECAVDYLKPFDDGAPTTPGTAPEQTSL